MSKVMELTDGQMDRWTDRCTLPLRQADSGVGWTRLDLDSCRDGLQCPAVPLKTAPAAATPGCIPA